MVGKLFKRVRRDERGSEVAQFAILVPLILFIFMMPVIFDLAIWAKIVVIDAAREGARYEALHLGDPNYIVQQTLIDGRLDPNKISQVTVSQGQTYDSVSVQYNQPTIMPGVGALLGGRLLGNTITVGSTSVFKIEQ